MELGTGLTDGAQSLSMRCIDFFLNWLDAARTLGFGPLYTGTTSTSIESSVTTEATDGPCWVLAKAVDELFRIVFCRFPVAPLTSALDVLSNTAVRKHTIKSLHNTPGAIDTKFVDFDVASDLALNMFLAEDARLHDLLFVRFMSADVDEVTGHATQISQRRRSADVSALFSLNHVTSVIHGMGLDWNDSHILRIFQQTLQRRTDGTVTVDDFVYCIRAHGALNVSSQVSAALCVARCVVWCCVVS
jgi:hypothetical protein